MSTTALQGYHDALTARVRLLCDGQSFTFLPSLFPHMLLHPPPLASLLLRIPLLSPPAPLNGPYLMLNVYAMRT
jgi:hypothetical protein